MLVVRGGNNSNFASGHLNVEGTEGWKAVLGAVEGLGEVMKGCDKKVGDCTAIQTSITECTDT